MQLLNIHPLTHTLSHTCMLISSLTGDGNNPVDIGIEDLIMLHGPISQLLETFAWVVMLFALGVLLFAFLPYKVGCWGTHIVKVVSEFE